MRDQSFTECPEQHCQMKKWGHGKVKRLLGTGAGLIFKGSGFYITDYRSNNYKEGAKKDTPAVDKPSGSKDTPAKASEKKPKPAE